MQKKLIKFHLRFIKRDICDFLRNHLNKVNQVFGFQCNPFACLKNQRTVSVYKSSRRLVRDDFLQEKLELSSNSADSGLFEQLLVRRLAFMVLVYQPDGQVELALLLTQSFGCWMVGRVQQQVKQQFNHPICISLSCFYLHWRLMNSLVNVVNLRLNRLITKESENQLDFHGPSFKKRDAKRRRKQGTLPEYFLFERKGSISFYLLKKNKSE